MQCDKCKELREHELKAYEIIPVLNRHYETGEPFPGWIARENNKVGQYYLREDVDKLLGRKP